MPGPAAHRKCGIYPAARVSKDDLFAFPEHGDIRRPGGSCARPRQCNPMKIAVGFFRHRSRCFAPVTRPRSRSSGFVMTAAPVENWPISCGCRGCAERRADRDDRPGRGARDQGRHRLLNCRSTRLMVEAETGGYRESHGIGMPHGVEGLAPFMEPISYLQPERSLADHGADQLHHTRSV